MREGLAIVKPGYTKTANGSVLATEGNVLYELDRETHIARILLNRPKQRNSLSRAMSGDYRDALIRFRDDENAWLLIITGAGEAFSSGHDLFEYLAPADNDGSIPPWDELYVLQRQVYKPIIAAINGPCLAQGGGIALLSDIRIMSDRAVMGWPQVKRGITSMSGPMILADLIPLGWALAYLMTGDTISPSEAHRLGLAHEVVPHGELMARAEAWAQRILANAPLAVSAMKQGVLRGRGLPFEKRGELLRPLSDQIKRSEDTAEGIRAFGEKRKPVWARR